MSQVALITGCSSGIGFETAKYFAQQDITTYASVRDLKSPGVKQLKSFSKDLPLHIIKLDVTKPQTIKSAITQIIKNEERIDILINNAGFGYVGAVEDFTIEEIKAQYNTNLFGAIRCIKAVTPHMRKQKSGLIINISSINGLVSFPLYGIYSSSKFALETITEVLRFELHPFGIKTVSVQPGTFLTQFTSNKKYPQKMDSQGSAYSSLTSRFFKLRQSAEYRAQKQKMNRFIHPQLVAKKLYLITQTSQPKIRYKVGLDAYLFHYARKILPYPIWSWAINKGFKWH